jgi:hypothetical protein
MPFQPVRFTSDYIYHNVLHIQSRLQSFIDSNS